jgi:sulfur carrier protein ThiS
MAQATVKLFASLSEYLPSNARENATEIAVPAEGTTIAETLAALKVPMEKCHLVLVNGIFVSPSARANTRIGEGDTLAVWPPVAGG